MSSFMSELVKYLESNKEKAYSFAAANTKYDGYGHPVISKDDEWVDETEWDELFQMLSGGKQKGE